MKRFATVALVGAATTAGFLAGRQDERSRHLVRVGGGTICCDAPQSPAAVALDARARTAASLVPKLNTVVGQSFVITEESKQRSFTKGMRIGAGRAIAVVQPGSLREMVHALQACVDADVAVVTQGANTGLTGGSVPNDACERPVVVLSTRRLTRVTPITTTKGNAGNSSGLRMLCEAGAGIHDLSQVANSHNVESHSVLGSMFLNPSVGAGVSLGSGGTQLRKGPSTTERAVYAEVCADGKVRVVSTLGLRNGLDGDTDSLLRKLDTVGLEDGDFDNSCNRPCHDSNYRTSVCTLDDHVSRYNADTAGIPVNRCEGKVLTLVTLHDTFPKPRQIESVWVSCKDFETAMSLRRVVCLANPEDLPASCEYMDGETVRVVDRAGRGLCLLLNQLGIGPRLRQMWDIKSSISALPLPFANVICDAFLYHMNPILPPQLPVAVQAQTAAMEHHVLLKLVDYGNGELARQRQRLHAFAKDRNKGTSGDGDGDGDGGGGSGVVGDGGGGDSIMIHTCKGEDIARADFFRFACAPAFATYAIAHGLQALSIDYALPKACEEIPPLAPEAIHRLRYGHLGCNVIHEDLTFDYTTDVHKAKQYAKRHVEAHGGRLPAEHGHGTEYTAPLETKRRWMSLDPTNIMNPGVGGLPYDKGYGDGTTDKGRG